MFPVPVLQLQWEKSMFWKRFDLESKKDTAQLLAEFGY
jgi:hypothetical protein